MRHLTKLGLVLSVIFLVSFLALAVELVYLLCYRRRSSIRRARTPTSKRLLFIFCRRNDSQVEPTSFPCEEDEGVDQDLEKCKTMQQSRMLFTIKEGDKEGAESEGGSSRTAAPQLIGSSATPNGSPPFFTPPSSPPRDSSFGYILPIKN